MSRRKISTTIYITPEQNEDLRLLHDVTKVPIAEYIRQGIDIILAKHRAQIPSTHPFAIHMSDVDLDELAGKGDDRDPL